MTKTTGRSVGKLAASAAGVCRAAAARAGRSCHVVAIVVVVVVLLVMVVIVMVVIVRVVILMVAVTPTRREANTTKANGFTFRRRRRACSVPVHENPYATVPAGRCAVMGFLITCIVM